MIISESWLREWVSPAVNTEQLADSLTMAGLEVETITPVLPLGTLVVVGEVVSIAKHSDAKKLNVCEVDVGTPQNLTIVCGAANVAQGIKAPVALVGAVLPNGMTIEQRSVRGVASSGMICASSELGLEEQSDGLLLLDSDAPVGATVDTYLNLDDNCIDVDLTPNRGDCLSIAGVAREVSVLTHSPLKPVAWDVPVVAHDQSVKISLSAPEACARYVGRIIRNVSVGASSPDWMKEKLRRGGIRSISPIVDVTNFVMLELGQPMHAFDYNKLEGDITVRLAKENEKLQLLDQRELVLSSEMLVIADNQKAIALAGIMGGANSEIDDNTTDIFLESAYFSPAYIAGKARDLGMQTDAAHRYERGVDSTLQRRACERASQLLLEIVGGEAGPICEVADSAHLPSAKTIRLRNARINTVLGLEVAPETVEMNLRQLGFKVAGEGGQWDVTAPSWRFDVSGEHDLVEEIGRTVSFDKVMPNPPQLRGEPHVEFEQSVTSHTIKQWMASADYHEVISYSFVDPIDQQRIHPDEAFITIGNPIAANMSVMRTSLWTGLIKTAQSNLRRQNKRIRLFEMGHVFESDEASDTGAKEAGKLACLLSGPSAEIGWANHQRDVDFFDLKGDIENLFDRVGKRADVTFVSATDKALHPGQSANIVCDGLVVGQLGQLHPKLVEQFDLNQAVYLAEIDMSVLTERTLPVFSTISRFPFSNRDLSLVVPKGVLAQDILTEINKNAGELLKSVVLFDNYEGASVGEVNKSLAFGLKFQSHETSLAADHVDSLVGSLLEHLQNTFGASLRG